MLTYFEELETTSDATLHLGNILQRGSLDTMMRRAEARAQAEFPRPRKMKYKSQNGSSLYEI